MALVVAEAAARAVEHVGMPEGRLILAEAALYVACAPKSNSVYKGIGKALQDVEKGAIGTVPNHLRDSSYSGAKNSAMVRVISIPITLKATMFGSSTFLTLS